MRNSLSTIFGLIFVVFILVAGIWLLPKVMHDETVVESTIDVSTLHQLNAFLTEAIIQDGFPPPVASRIYAYCNLAAYEVVAVMEENVSSFAGNINDLPKREKIDFKKNIHLENAMIEAFVTVGKEMVYRDHILDSARVQIVARRHLNNKDEASKRLGQLVASNLLVRAKNDNYLATRNYSNYSVIDDEFSWRPTPPTYREALEPHWNEVTPFVIDSAEAYFVDYIHEPSLDEESEFYKYVMEVYDSVRSSSSEDSLIAHFWDCNPLLTRQSGHLMFNIRQLTPGGHWMGIARIACMKENYNMEQTARVYAMTAIAMADAFIVAWDTKYKTNLIRPETIINKYIDPYWRPLLETPPFPEHTSAHSTVSSAAATILTHEFGNDYDFVDSTEVPFGLPPRNFDSFYQASDEASISRILGGIHYRPAIELGILQGIKIGNDILTKLEDS